MAPEPTAPTPVAQLPERYRAAEVSGERDTLRWWGSFSDPVLDAVVDSALARNFDLAEAVARVEEARALAGAAGAGRYPSVDATANASESRSPSNSGFGDQLEQLLGELSGSPNDSTPPDDPGGGEGDEGGEGETRRIVSTTFSTNLNVSYEVDFWGRIGADAAAATRDLLASEADLRTARLQVIAETISAYFQLVDLRRRVDLVAETVEVLAERERLTEDRYDRGLVTSFELYQVRQDLRNTQASLPQLERQLAATESRLAVLVGRYSPELDAILADSLAPTLVTDPVPVGMPSDLLAQRPDVQAAAQRYEAARLRVGARRAELFPRLTLSASIGLQSSEIDNAFDLDQWASNLVAGLTAPIFQGGRLRANVSAAEARYARQAAVFARAVLGSVEEVETALSAYREERRRYDFLDAQLAEAGASVDLLASRYAAGVAGYADYLDAVRTQLNVQSTLSAAGQAVALSLLDVHRALGGGWVDPVAAADATEEP